MVTLRATRRATHRGDEWEVKAMPGGDADASSGEQLADATIRGKARLREDYARLAGTNALWQLELTKSVVGAGEIALGYADRLAEACVVSATGIEQVTAPGDWLSHRAALHALHARGLALRPGGALRDRLSFVLVSVAALISVAWTAVRHGHEGSRLPANAHTLWSVHGEWSTRTRHLLGLLPDVGQPAAIIVLGRPRGSLKVLRESWQRAVGMPVPRLSRPISVSAFLRAMPNSLRALADGFVPFAEHPWLPSWRERLAMAYRVVLGTTSAAWWRDQPPGVQVVYYGHTGPADSTALELAQQASGARTVHLVHGLSAGVNLNGRSDEAWFRCANDAAWHHRLGGYVHCCVDAAALPSLRTRGSGVLLLTNCAHPMNSRYRLDGIAAEMHVLELAAAAFQGARPMTWKPHPVFAQLPAAERERLATRASILGFRRARDDAALLELAGEHATVLSTPSTVVLELLAGGVLPVLVDTGDIDPDSALGTYPLRAASAAGLTAARVRVDGEGDALFEQAWSAIGPARPLRLPRAI